MHLRPSNRYLHRSLFLIIGKVPRFDYDRLFLGFLKEALCRKTINNLKIIGLNWMGRFKHRIGNFFG